ncbi:FmdE family protein [Syntrophorhabdus aromaticivorans]|uniref:FmdE family protein n=1 Tax=Syntrophorhabdus aromaticivorans TaxID=328301 RepID=UPI00040BD488|nr:FmdE family protein [Syntrophorhabdus aromaticivorans]
MERENLDLVTCLENAKAFHGELCAGITLGTRMSILGLKAIGIDDPKGKDRKNIIVFTETDRCVTDAVLATTGCHPGKRTMKIHDYGKMAATFVNLKTGRAVRVVLKNKDGDKETTREEIEQNPHTGDYAMMPAEDLFEITEVSVDLKPEDMPGKPLHIVTCSSCGERIMDVREVYRDGKILCKPCASGSNYYTPFNGKAGENTKSPAKEAEESQMAARA